MQTPGAPDPSPDPGASTVVHRQQSQAWGWQRCFVNFSNYFRRRVWRECSKFRNIYFDVACFSLSFKHMFFCLRMINIFLMFFLTEGKPVLYIN